MLKNIITLATTKNNPFHKMNKVCYRLLETDYMSVIGELPVNEEGESLTIEEYMWYLINKNTQKWVNFCIALQSVDIGMSHRGDMSYKEYPESLVIICGRPITSEAIELL